MPFTLTTSFSQVLSHLVLIAICLTSFILWPDIHHWAYQLVFAVTLTIALIFFIQHLFTLRQFHTQFVLLEQGVGKLNHQYEFIQWRAPIVTVFASVIFIEFEITAAKKLKKTRQLVIVWSDMLSDKEYRSLCRELVKLQSML
ncbi:protein YgfX [Shewanella japonica]|uniref:Toxin CptA n=1 Tax=Shewanella japonica TaxID=93973 RepID=A0ABM6JK08_9GAMM|nr:protein YgfX [Shewanella japonica]ARD21552.1 hypothetical protein SJ2017_1227 [Shewanella japonica]